jgi:hypothetical protein
MHAASLHEAVTTSSDSSVTIGKASQCVCSQENPKHFQRNHVVAMCNTENPNPQMYAASLHEAVATSSRCCIQKSCLSNTIHLMTCLLQSLSLSLSLSLSRSLRNPRRGENKLRKLTSFIADGLSLCCCFSSSRQVHCCCHLLLSKITVCTQPKLQEASNWNSPCYQALHTRGLHARMISL